MMVSRWLLLPLAALCALFVCGGAALQEYSGDELKGRYPYDLFKEPERCRSCHVEIYEQWAQSLMAQAYTHHWDEIEYFKLAVPHSERDSSMVAAQEGCNGCHAPLAYWAGDVPPPRPEAGSRANEAVSCVVCHVIGGYRGDPPFNYSYVPHPGDVYYGNRPGEKSPEHETRQLELFSKAELCANCHNEQSPSGVWVKGTHLEWLAGPYSREGVQCQDCHMPPAPFVNAKMGKPYPDVRLHFFHGAHDENKVRGAIEMSITPDEREVELGESVRLTLALFNGKCGHKVPSGSAEERQLWVRVEATDSSGAVFHLPVDRKGFEGEEATITSNDPAYQDIGEIMGIEGFQGLARDALPEGDRIFCLPYYDPQGRRTICQWNTASLGVDYRIAPRQAVVETYTWELPDGIAEGEVTVRAVLRYRRLVKSVAEFLEVPADETEAIIVNEAATVFTVFD